MFSLSTTLSVTSTGFHTARSSGNTSSTCKAYFLLQHEVQLIYSRFPDRVGRVVIDGVVDAIAWASTFSPSVHEYARPDMPYSAPRLQVGAPLADFYR